MKKYLAIGGLVLVTVIWGGGFVASDIALESLRPFPGYGDTFSARLGAYGRYECP